MAEMVLLAKHRKFRFVIFYSTSFIYDQKYILLTKVHVYDKISGGHFFFIMHQLSQQMINNTLWAKFVYFYMNIYENIKIRDERPA